ncbi:MAG: DUF115 domain-containing protein [Spirochaetaceae bacterium]|jgi:hypothetical protein|nr:DUF115 domain-containing protein [Spirochaetaceae bacterium]
MNYWESNSAVLKEKFPGLLEQISADETPYQDELRLETAVSGAPVLTVKGLHVHSLRDPVREGRRLAETIAGTGPIVVLGFGLGYAAEAAAEKAGNRPIIIAEARGGLLKKALETRDLRSFLAKNQLIFVIGGTGGGITEALQLCSQLKSRNPSLIRNRTLMKLDEDWYAQAERRITVWISKDQVNTATLKRFGKRWIRNLARNLTAVRDIAGVERLAGVLPSSMPVFLAAAGPSLDAVIPILPEIYRRCAVVAVDTSLRVLLQAGVDPDFTVSVDPQYWNSRHLDWFPAPRTSLIAESAVYPPVLRHPFARTFLCSSLFPLGRFIEDRLEPKGSLGAGGSVATTAWDFARMLGTASIWIAGLDLSFPELKTHFKGALFEDRALAESTRLNPAETWSVRALRDGSPFRARSAEGGTVLTDRRLSLYAAWFENRILSAPEVRNYRLSGSGIAIPGLQTASAEEFLNLPVRRDEINRRFAEVFKRTDDDFGNPARSAQRNAQYQTALRELLDGLEQITSCAASAAETADTAYRRKRLPPQERDAVLKKLASADTLIRESPVKDAAGFLMPPVEELEANLKNGETDPFFRYLALSAELYRSLSKAAEYTLAVLTFSKIF